MRKFIVSDIHGFGNVYYSMMNYLDNIRKNEEIELYINGDLIDRGLESVEILLDIKKRIEDNIFKIVYLGGNHELLMHEFYLNQEKNHKNYFNDWYENGGYITEAQLDEEFDHNDKKIHEIVEFISNLKLYYKFEEKICDRPIVLVHAACPSQIKDDCDIRIKNDNPEVSYMTWTREHEVINIMGYELINPHEQRVGHKDYFTIIGHTPIHNKYGFEYHSKQNYLNIDGGCGIYVRGEFNYNHFPLVEVCDGYLKILTFNSNNEIIYGNYFDGNKRISYKKNELIESRKYIDKNVKIKKLSINKDGICGYWN